MPWFYCGWLPRHVKLSARLEKVKKWPKCRKCRDFKTIAAFLKMRPSLQSTQAEQRAPEGKQQTHGAS
jgi:hypothetical protein